jgi:hypothetical protein
MQDIKGKFSKDKESLKKSHWGSQNENFLKLNKKFSWKSLQHTNQVEDRLSELEDKVV